MPKLKFRLIGKQRNDQILERDDPDTQLNEFGIEQFRNRQRVLGHVLRVRAALILPPRPRALAQLDLLGFDGVFIGRNMNPCANATAKAALLV